MKRDCRFLIACSAAIVTCAFGVATSEAAGPTKLRAPRTYPLVISAPGSYVLVENFVVPDVNTSAIRITANDVTLDLDGFVISGPVVCNGYPAICSGSGTGDGIVGVASNAVIRNGTVRGMGRAGISINGGILEGVRAVSNGQHGISGVACLIRDSVVAFNGTDGISGYGCVITNNVAVGNTATGILMSWSAILGNTALGNGTYGIYTDAGAAHDNMTLSNGDSGIRMFGGTAVGNATYANEIYGIRANTNTGMGFNSAINNMVGETLSGHQLANNLCGNDMTCP
ncbi:MAG TPA: hypothetical protein VEL28_20750 [Candidatus Binatia bacterium]|nr:hypothetical protein [Candidatus Binatia bacterium]